MRALFVGIILLSTQAVAGPDHSAPAQVSPNFTSMKELVGTWEGSSEMNGKKEPVKVIYELTSGGTALIEKLMPGTPHEMVSVYANQGKDVKMTHYCMLGNQPQMKLKKVEGGTFSFVMDGNKGIANKNEPHMHAVTLTLADGKLKQEWVNYKDNKKGEVAVFEFTKKK